MGESYASRIAIYDRDGLMRLDELDKKITQSDSRKIYFEKI